MADARRFIIVGLGGIGSHLADFLAPMLEYSLAGSMLLLVDGDNFEPKNLERQSFADLGNKAATKATELAAKFPKTFISPVPKFVVDSFPQGVQDSDTLVLPHEIYSENCVVFAVVDNFATRKVLFDSAEKYENIDVFHGGNDDAYEGSLWHYQRRDNQEITEHPREYYDVFINPPDRNPGLLSCQEKAALAGQTQLIATNAAVAAYLVARVKKTIIDNQPPVETEIFFDLGLGRSSPVDYRTVNLVKN